MIIARHLVLASIVATPVLIVAFGFFVGRSERHLHVSQAIKQCRSIDTIPEVERICALEYFDAGMMGVAYVRITRDLVAVSYNGGWRHLLGKHKGNLLYPFYRDRSRIISHHP